ncbi:MAG: hypothetical protein R2695_05645 [Acidimicrobiales bacterium]
MNDSADLRSSQPAWPPTSSPSLASYSSSARPGNPLYAGRAPCTPYRWPGGLVEILADLSACAASTPSSAAFTCGRFPDRCSRSGPGQPRARVALPHPYDFDPDELLAAPRGQRLAGSR